jgi:hypothetical protein
LEPPAISAKVIAPAIGAYTGAQMRRIALAGLGIGLLAMWASSVTAQQAQAPAQAPPDSGRGYTYQNSAPNTSSGPAITFQFGKWGSQPSDYPYGQTWSQHARPDDNACNMPSSPCWNEDRE